MNGDTGQAGGMAGSALVIGGGVAGIAAALRLAEHDVAVTLVETRKRLGGRATSFNDPTTGELVDNCQHVVMRCCTNILDLYRRLGVENQIEWHRTLHFADASGEIDVFASDDLPAPLHLVRAMLGMGTLSWRDKFAISQGMLAILQMADSQAAFLSDISFHDWLREQAQPRSAIERFWSAVIISACNERPENVAARYGIQVFREGFLASDRAYEVGLSTVALADLYDRAEAMITRRGGRLMLSTSAEGFTYDGQRITGLRLADSPTLHADAYISAVPFDRLGKLSTEAMLAADARLRGLNELRVSPIIGVHLYVKRDDGDAAMSIPHVALLDSPVQWVFNKGCVETGPLAGLWYLHGVISAAHDLVDVSAEQIVQLAFAEVRRAVPEAAEATLVHGRAIKEKRATFSIRPGVDRLRPPAAGAIANLLLAGDWTDTGWPATMEGAAISGYRAAEATLRVLGHSPRPLVVDGLVHSPLYRFMVG